MKLYFAPGACSLSPHIVMREVGANFDLEQVNNQEKKTKSGADYWTINAKGQVPVLEFDNGERLTEGPVIVQWIADQYGNVANAEHDWGVPAPRESPEGRQGEEAKRRRGDKGTAALPSPIPHPPSPTHWMANRLSARP